MKYNQFLELEAVLRENDVTVKDIKEKPKVLNEVAGLLLLGGALATGLGLIFGKRLVGLGVKQIYLIRLKKIAKRYERVITRKTSKIGQKTAKLRQAFISKEKILQGIEGEEAEAELEALMQRKRNYDRKITRDIDEMVIRNSAFKTKEVQQRIDEINSLRESQKLALKGFWELLIIDIKVDAFNNLIEDGIITDESVIDALKAEFAEEKEDAKDKMSKVSKKLKDEKREEAKPTDDKAKTSEFDVDKISNNIKELASERESIGDEETSRQSKLIIKDIKKLEKEQRDILYQLFVDEFGREFVIKLRKEISGAIEKKRERQSSLKTVNL